MLWAVGGLVNSPVPSTPEDLGMTDLLGSEGPCSLSKAAEHLSSGNRSLLQLSLSTPMSATYRSSATERPSATQLRPCPHHTCPYLRNLSSAPRAMGRGLHG